MPGTLSVQVAHSLYRSMIRIRRFEEHVRDLYALGELPGFVHLYIGEEAVAAGVCEALRPEDCITSTHRGHAHCIAKGASLDRMMAELFGKESGYCSGRGGSMHISDLSIGILGANGIVGAGVPIAVGAAFAMQLQGEDRVAVTFFGDGATNTGAFHEAMNLAATWQLPVVFVCENNEFALSVPLREHQNISTAASRAAGYEIRSTVVDGNDVLRVLDVARTAVAAARNGDGPTFIECKTYRFRGHSEGDPLPPGLEEWYKRCPIRRFRATLTTTSLATAEELEAIDAEAEREVMASIEFARSGAEPSPGEAARGLFTE